MRLSVYVNGSLMDGDVLIDGLEIVKNITDRVSTATMNFRIQGGDASRYDEAHFDQDTYSVDLREFYELAVVEKDTLVKQFSGTIRNMNPDRKAAGVIFTKVDCQDWSTILDESYIPYEQFTGQTDQQIIMFLGNKYGSPLRFATGNIQQIVPLPTWEVKDKTLRQALDEIIEFTGGEWRIDWDKNLIYFNPTTYNAPFGFSSTPNSLAGNIGLVWDDMTGSWNTTNVTWDEAQGLISQAGSSTLVWNAETHTWDEAAGTWDSVGGGIAGVRSYGIDAFTSYNRDAIRLVNQCTFIGGVIAGAVTLRMVYDDPLSQADYGIKPITVVDSQVTDASMGILRAKAVVEENAYPKETISLRTLIDGLEVGQALPIYHKDYDINGTYIIREMRMRQITRSLTEYQITCGDREADAVRLLRMLEARTRRFTGTPTAVPAAGSVTDSSIALGGLHADSIGTINAGSIIGAITSNQIGTINAAQISGVISSTQIGTVSAGSIQGVITADQIGSVNATSIEGVIISSQVADGLIDSLSKIAAPLRVIPNKASAPSLPSPDYPDKSFYYNTVLGVFYQNIGGVWVQVQEGEAVVGKLEYYHIGTVKASKIVGVILANQIDTVTASQITGQINASQIGSINASAIIGGLTASNITSVNASVIQGQLTSSQIASVSATQITGTFTSTQISSVSAGSITGQLVSTQIATVNAGSITGSVVATQIGSLNGNVINVGSVDDSKIGSVSAGKITAGTIFASISIQSPSINGGQLSGSALTISAAGCVLDTGPTVFDPTYGALAFKATDSSLCTSYLVGRGLVIFQSGFQIASLNRSPANSTAGEMVLYKSGTINIICDGNTGVVRANAGFQVGNAPGILANIFYKKQDGTNGFMSFVGGILYNQG